MKKKKPKGYKAGGVTQQELAEMKALAKLKKSDLAD